MEYIILIIIGIITIPWLIILVISPIIGNIMEDMYKEYKEMEDKK